MNRISGQKFARDLAGFLNFDPVLLPIAIDAIPKGILSKQQKEGLKFFFNNPDVPIFAGKLGDTDLAQGLDPENFGNAITPMLLDLLYDDGMGDRTDPNRKYLTRDNLHVYVRVPSVDIDGVTFELSNGERQEGVRAVDPDVFGSETIRYNFRLEEALAATNLPAWPGIVDENTSIFESVTLRYSTEGLNGRYTGYEMHRVLGPNGIVWETGDSVDITPGNNYYYFDVTLTDAVTLEILDLSKIEELRSPTLSQILDATTTYTIKKWSMPDPRNLQLADRGILERLIDDEVKAELSNLTPVLLASLANEQIPSGRELGKLQNILQRNAYKVLTRFTDAFDPQLSSVFSVPKIDTTSESIWVTEFTDIPEGNYFLGATVYDADENLDRMQGEFTVDTEAPKADVEIAAEKAIEMSAHNATNTAGYQNREGVYVATALKPGAATLNIMGNPTSGRVEEGYGYLIYQIIGLDPSGDPYIGDPSLQRPNTWMPLTIESTMLASVVWDQLKEQLTRQGIEIPSELNLPLDAIQGLLDVLITPAGGALLETQAPQINATLKAIGDVLGVRLQLEDDGTRKLLADVLGSAIEILNAVPITYGDNNVQMPIQGENVPLLKGHYGIRAMGIDTLFNVSSHTPPTRLQIIEQEGQHDQVVVTAVSIGDRNGDGIVGNRWWESGHIFANTTEGVMLTLNHEKIAHLIDHENASVVVQYMGADGQWQDIPSDNLLSALESSGTASVTWDVTDFDALVAAGNTVKVRAVATNALTIEDPDPMTFEINLDPGVHPVDPEVLALAVDESTITATNPDSGAPQGTFTIDAYTPQRTSLEIESLRLEIQGGEYADWTDLGVSSAKGDLVSDTKASDLVEAAMQEKVASDTYQYWSFTVDTTQLADTITMDTLEVAHALATGATDENMYSVRAIAVLSDGSDDVEDPAEQPMDSFSVDNVDDVGPLGPTNLVVSGVDAFEDTAVFVDNGDGTYTVGGLVDIYDDGVNPPAATFTIKPTAKRTTYETIELRVNQAALDAGVEIISESVEETASGEFTVTVTVEIPEDTDELSATSGPYTFHAVAIDVVPNVQTHNLEDGALSETNGMPSIDVTVTNTYRPNPGILAITVDDAEDTNPDSGAPRGIVVLNGYTHEITSPATEMVRFEVSNDEGSTWIDVGTTEVVETVTEEQTPALLDDLVKAVVTGNPEVPIVRQKWSHEVDTAALLADTISAEEDLDQAHGLKADDNPYMVRAVAITPKRPDNDETVSEDDVNTASFSVDNIDDVGPLGPTHITMVSDVAGQIAANDDNSYTVGGIVAIADEPRALQENIATFTIDPSARPITYAGGNARLVRMNPDGTSTMDDSTTTFVGDADDEVVTITINVDELANGTYTFHALAIDAVPNVQTHNLEDGALVDTNGMPSITVHVVNFRVSDISELAVIAVDGTDVATPPMEPIPLRESLKLNFNVIPSAASDPNRMYTLNMDELTGASDETTQQAVPHETAEDSEKTFSLMVSLDQLQTDGLYTPHGVVTKRNGWVGFPLAEINRDRTPPNIMVNAPLEGHTVSNLPTVRATYNDGAGAGVEFGDNYYPWAMDVSPDAPNMFISLKRLKPHLGENDVVQSEVDTAVETLVYTRKEELTGGAYQFDVTVIDRLGNSDTQSVAFAVEGVEPTVLIHDPASGTTFNHRRPTVSGFFAGVEVKVTKSTFDGEEVTLNQTGEQFSYKHPDALTDGEHTLAVEVMDEDGRTAEASVTFTVTATAPVISAVAPTGKVEGMAENNPVMLSAVVTDDQSAITSVTFSVDGGEAISVDADQLSDGRVEVDAGMFAAGVHTVDLTAMSEGGTTEHQWMFEIIPDTTPPVISAAAPTGKVEGMAENNPVMLSAVVTDDHSAITSVTFSVDGGEAISVDADQLSDGRVEVDAGMFAAGVHTVDLTAMSEGGTTEHQWMFEIIPDTTPPVISAAAPTGKVEGMAENNPVMLSAVVTDDHSAITSVTFSVDGGEAISVDADQLSDGRVEVDAGMFAAGVHTVDLTAMSEGGTTEHQWMFEIIPDTTPPVISAAAPTGKVEGMAENNPVMLSAVVTDDHSAITSVTFSVDGGEAISVDADQLSDGRVEVDAGMFAAGVHTVDLTAMSEGGTTEHQWMFEIVPDTTPPVISAVAPTGKVAGANGDNSVTLSAVVTDDQSAVTSVSVSVDDADPEVITDAETINDGRIEIAGVFQEGEHTVTLIAESDGGTTEHQWMFEIVPDTTPPVISAVAPTGKIAGSKGSNAVMLSAVVTDDESTVTSVSISVDDADPEVITDAETINDGRIEIAGVFQEGEHTVTLIAESDGGTTEHQWMFEIVPDMTPPVITAVAPEGLVKGTQDDRMVTISAVVTDEQSPVESIRFILDGELVSVKTSDEELIEELNNAVAGNGDPIVERLNKALGPVTHSVTIEVDEPRSYNVEVIATSEGGTTEHTWTFTFVRDTTPPVISAVAPTGKIAGANGDNSVMLSAVVTDDESTVTSVSISVDDADPEVITDAETISDGRIEIAGVFQEGEHTVTLVAESDGGTTEHQWMFEIVPDTTPPVISAVAPTGKIAGSKGSNAVMLSAVVTDDESTVTSVSISVDDADPEVITDAETINDGRIEIAGVFQEGEHTVTLIAESDGGTTEHQWMFEIVPDTTPPVISAVAPTGIIKDSDPAKLGAVVISAVVTDEQSTVSSVRYSINGSPELPVPRINIVEGKITAPVDYEANGDGLYSVRLTATSEGGTTEHTWTFTLIVDNVKPTITSITPSGTIRNGLPVISASANDESGVAEMSIVVIDSDGEEVSGETLDDGEDNVSGITRLDFNPDAPLEEGTYTIQVRATDPYSNSSSAIGTFTVDFDTAPPVITVSSPHQDTQILLKAGDKAPTISITYTDAESGVNVDSIRFILNDQLLTLTDKQKSASQVIYQLPISAAAIEDIHDYSWVGEYSVQLEVSDNAHLESDGSEANTTVHTFSFSVGKAGVPLLSKQPINVPNPFVDSTEIRFTLTRKAKVNIVIYDMTLRPVQVLVDDIAEPGEKEIEWNGTSSSGEDLARGIYFCQIIVGDDIEPEYAILKLALTR